MLRSSRFLSSFVVLAVLVSGCRKAQPTAKATAAPPSAQPAVVAPQPSVSVSPSPTLARRPAPPAPPPRKPTPLDAAGLRSAKTYLAELSAGRKATLAKDYEQAEAHFSKCLEALPGDPRALAERGYARLLANKLPEADADLAAAAQRAPSSAVLVQIVHNRMLVARQRGDEAAAKSFEAEKKKLKAGRRLPSGVTCNSDVSDSDLEPIVTTSLDDALKRLLTAHAAEDHVELGNVEFVTGPFHETDEVEALKATAAQGPLPEGGVELWSRGDALRNHALISHAGKLYGYPNLSSGNQALCGLDDAAVVTVGGGGAVPWYIRREYRNVVRGYTEFEGGQTMGFCSWTSSSVDVTILDSKTFAGIRKLSASAQPTDADTGNEPEHLMELEWLADKVLVDVCGQRSVVPYVAE